MDFKVGDTVEYASGPAPQSLKVIWRRGTVVDVGQNSIRVDEDGNLFWVSNRASRVRKVDDATPE